MVCVCMWACVYLRIDGWAISKMLKGRRHRSLAVPHTSWPISSALRRLHAECHMYCIYACVLRA